MVAMRISRFPSSYISDHLNEGGFPPSDAAVTAGQMHRDGVVRGIFLLLCLGIPVLTSFGSVGLHTLALSADASASARP
jgi:hypothetical protein